MREAISAQTWGRRLKGLPPDLNIAEIDGIVIHYTGNPRVDARGLAVPAYIRGIQEHHLNHKSAGWTAIAYNYLIDQEGRLWEGRGLDFRNAANNPTNRTTVSICLLNGVQDNDPTLEQIETVHEFHRELQQRTGKPISITGHQEHSATACPGERIQWHVANGTFHAKTAPEPARPPAAGETLIKPPSCTVYQARAWAEQNNAHRRFIDDIIPATFQAADAQRAANAGRAIDPAVALAQAAKETGWGQFRGVLRPARHNPAGIKIAAGGDNFDPDAHESWPTWAEGARAHLNHLAAYTGLTPVGTPHGRYHTVRRTEWAGTIETAEQLGARWAPAGTYGEDVARMTRDLQQTPNRVTQPEPAKLERRELRNSSVEAQRVYTVMPGDSWWRIAQIQLNNGTRWQEIADLNDRVALHPGMIIKLP